MLNIVVDLEYYVGTSGWFYPWNEERNLDWYVANSGKMLSILKEVK